MAISAAMRNDIIELAVITNNAAPGTTLLAELVALADAGKTLTQIADTLVARSAFTATYPTHQTAAEFGAEWVGNLLPEASAALQAECVVIVEAHMNGGGSIAALMADVQVFMSTNTSTNLATHIANFNNKVAVATYHTITKEAAAEWTIPATVTSTASTVATGKTAVDTALAPAAAVAATTYTLTATAGSINEGDSGQSNMVYTLALDKAAESATIVNYQTLTTGTGTVGDDFDSTAGSVTFAAGQQNASVTVKVNGDTAFETNETVKVTFSGSDLVASVTTTGTVTNDDSDPNTLAMAKTLTTGKNVFTTGSAADTFDATTAGSLDTIDVIDGGAGSDTLTATSGGESMRPTISNVETISVTATAGTLTVDTRDISGTTIWNNESSAGAVTLNNLSTVPAVNINSGTDDTTINFTDAALAAASQTLSIGVNDYVQSTGESITVTDAGGTTNKLEAITINSASLASTITALTTTGVGTTTLTVTGDANLTITDAVAMTTVSAADFTGNLSVGGPAGASTYTGGSGNDTLTTGAGNDTLTGGAGNDILAAAAGTNTVNAGAGNDAITITTGKDTVDSGAGNDSITQADTSAITTADALTGGDGTDTLILSEANTAFNAKALADGILVGIEKIEVSGTGAITVDDANVTQAGGTLTLQETGDDATLTTVSANVSAGKTVVIDAVTATLANAATGTVNRVTLATTKDSDADTLTSDETGTTLTLGTGNDIVTGGGSIDTITTGTGTNSVTGGAGADIINVADGGGTDTIDGGAGNDVIKVVDLSDMTSADTITGGAGSDTLKSGETTGDWKLSTYNNLSGIDVFEMMGASTLTIDDANVAQSDSNKVTVTETGTDADITLSAAVSAAYTVTISNTGQTTTLADGVVNRVTLAATGEIVVLGTGADIVTGGAGIDTITLDEGNAVITGGAGADIFKGTNAALDGFITIDAGAGVDVLNVTDASTVVDNEFSGMTNFETLLNGDVASSITFGATADAAGFKTYTGGTGVDTFSVTADSIMLLPSQVVAVRISSTLQAQQVR